MVRLSNSISVKNSFFPFILLTDVIALLLVLPPPLFATVLFFYVAHNGDSESNLNLAYHAVLFILYFILLDQKNQRRGLIKNIFLRQWYCLDDIVCNLSLRFLW